MASLMTRIGEVTRLRTDPAGRPATLRLSGTVGPVLESTCVWAPGQPGGGTGAIRAVDVAADGLRFGLGAGAFGTPPEQAIQRLGEYVLVDGTSWWTPAATPTQSRPEPPGVPVLTPFLLRWDQMATAVATLRSGRPVPLARWYEYLIARLTGLGHCPAGTIVAEIIADMPASQITDKHLVRPPLRQNRPPGPGLITDEAHLDEYFLRNAAARASGPGAWCTAIMAGVAVHPAAAAAAWGSEFVQHGFYITPGTASRAAVLQHTHGLVTAQLAEPSDGDDRLAGLAGLLAGLAAGWADGTRAVQAIHVESDTLLYRAEARIGVVGTITTDAGYQPDVS